jgi:LCP family protein required for cell wall assembly
LSRENPATTTPRTPAQVSPNSGRNGVGNGGARLNGNGNGKPKRGRFWRGLGVVLLLAIVAGVAYVKLTPHGRDTYEALTNGVKVAYQVKQNPTLIFDDAGSDHVNILLIGRDVNYKPAKVYDPRTKTYRPFHVVDKDSPARSDSMIVMVLDKTKGTLRMVSLPRDATVHLPPNEYHVRRGKLNAAHAYGGPALLLQTLHDELGLTIQHYAVIKFDGFKKLIDQVGGVEVNVEGALLRNRETGKLYRGNLKYDDNWGNLHQNLKPGMQTLNGQQAHDYVRFREDIEGDTGRMRRQQQVMRALAKKIMHAGPFEIPSLIKELRRQFETDLTDDQLASAAYFTRALGDSTKVQPITLFGVYSSRGSMTLNRPKNEKLLKAIFGSTFNKKNFLVNSPSTDDDEIGMTNDSNPGAQEVLREAGLIKGDATPQNAPSDDNDMSPVGRSTEASPESSTRSADANASSGATAPDATAPDNVVEPSATPPVASSNDRVVIASTDSSPAPTRRRHRRRTRRASSEASISSRTSSSSREVASSSREVAASPGESPVPQAESGQAESGANSPGDLSPVPQVE